MPREVLYFVSGALLVLLPLIVLLALKKLDLFEPRAHHTIHYGNAGERALKLHIFYASDSAAPVPALLLFHGGGWRYGQAQQFFPQCEFFAQRGITCISAEYRLGPLHAPDIRGAISDAGAALDYLHEHAADLGVDSHRIFAGGGSAGGHLAAALGAGMHGKTRRRPAALALYNPVVDLSPCTPSHHLTAKQWREVSPLHNVDARFPPTLILSGELDSEVTPAMVNAFCAAVQAEGGQCQVALYAGLGHGFFNPREDGNPAFAQTSARVADFISAHSD